MSQYNPNSIQAPTYENGYYEGRSDAQENLPRGTNLIHGESTAYVNGYNAGWEKGQQDIQDN